MFCVSLASDSATRPSFGHVTNSNTTPQSSHLVSCPSFLLNAVKHSSPNPPSRRIGYQSSSSLSCQSRSSNLSPSDPPIPIYLSLSSTLPPISKPTATPYKTQRLPQETSDNQRHHQWCGNRTTECPSRSRETPEITTTAISGCS